MAVADIFWAIDEAEACHARWRQIGNQQKPAPVLRRIYGGDDKFALTRQAFSVMQTAAEARWKTPLKRNSTGSRLRTALGGIGQSMSNLTSRIAAAARRIAKTLVSSIMFIAALVYGIVYGLFSSRDLPVAIFAVAVGLAVHYGLYGLAAGLAAAPLYRIGLALQEE